VRRPLRIALQVAGAAALVGIGAAIGSAGSSPSASSPAPAVTVTASAAAAAPAPAVTVTETVSPPPPAAGEKIATFKGSGNAVTPPFNVPDSGNYIVTWYYSGNVDTSFGNSQPANFSVANTGDGLGGDLPNDIAASGHGSTEVTGGTGTDRFNVQAAGSWTITVTAA
jgi:hypothetical protein